MKLINRIYHFLVAIRSFIVIQRSSEIKVGFLRTISMMMKGFYGESYVLYDFHKNNPKDYLSNYARFRTRFINKPYNIMLKDKDVFETVMSPYIDIPRSLGIIKHGQFCPKEAGLSLDKILESLTDSPGVIVKPLEGSGGYNIHLLRARGEEYFLNDKSIGRQQLLDWLAQLNNYLVSEYVQQGDYAQKIFPDSTNTIRILTMIDPQTGQPFITAAVHRFGCSTTVPTDNCSQGGMSAKIDIETGVIGKAATYSYTAGQKLWLSHHPETGEKIEGEFVTNWEEVKEKILYLARTFSFLKYVAWDVVATNSGLKVIEGNNFSELKALQFHQGLLVDPRAVKFYKHYKVI